MAHPFEGADDETLAAACIRNDEGAYDALFGRYGTLIVTAALRELDGARIVGEHGEEVSPREHDPRPLFDAIEEYLWRNEAAAFRAWTSRESTLRAWLCVVARHTARRLADVDRARDSLVAFFPTPVALSVSEVHAEERGAKIDELLERLPPPLGALARLRLRGMDRTSIATALGLPQTNVTGHLDKIAARLAELIGGLLTPNDQSEGEITITMMNDAFRVVVGAADAAERARAALRTEDEPAFRRARSIAEASWRGARARVLQKRTESTPMCLDDRAIAGLVDGTMRGATRARSEGHVGACPRCVDEVAALSTDLRAVPVLRDAQGLPSPIAVAAACLATTRFDVARRIVEPLAHPPEQSEVAALPTGEAAHAQRTSAMAAITNLALDLQRIAATAQLVEGGKPRPPDSSGTVVRAAPGEADAPIVAFEALVNDDPHRALSAIDEPHAREPALARLRMLAASAGGDLVLGRKLAADMLARPRVDPGAVDDAESVLALPDHRALPREIVVERARDVLPEVVRSIVGRAARG